MMDNNGASGVYVERIFAESKYTRVTSGTWGYCGVGGFSNGRSGKLEFQNDDFFFCEIVEKNKSSPERTKRFCV